MESQPATWAQPLDVTMTSSHSQLVVDSLATPSSTTAFPMNHGRNTFRFIEMLIMFNSKRL